jgi:hypothetical protein
MTKARDKQIGGNHYKSMKIQPSEYITANNIGWFEGNAIKYISRYKQKGGKADIEKAIHYLELLLEKISSEEYEDNKTYEIPSVYKYVPKADYYSFER